MYNEKDKIGCLDNSCIFQCIDPFKGGMRTNGGCRCFEDLIIYDNRMERWNREEIQRVRRWTQLMARRIRELESQIAPAASQNQ